MTEEEALWLRNKSYFTPTLLASDPYPAGFEDWVAQITQWKYTLTLPDKSTVDARLFMDLQQRWEAGNYTQYLLNRYEEDQT